MDTTGDLDTAITCPLCKQGFTLRATLMRTESYWAKMGLLIAKSSCCGSREELALRNGVLQRGYVYAAGQPHFAAMEAFAAPDVRTEMADDTLTLHIGAHRIVVRVNA